MNRGSDGFFHPQESAATDGTRIKHGLRKAVQASDPCFVRVQSVAESWFTSQFLAQKRMSTAPENHIRVIRGLYRVWLRPRAALGRSSPSRPVKTFLDPF